MSGREGERKGKDRGGKRREDGYAKGLGKEGKRGKRREWEHAPIWIFESRRRRL